MAKLKRSSLFEARLRQRATRRIRALFEKRLKLFQKNPFDPALNTHTLKHEWEGYLSFSLTDDEGPDDYRVIFEKVRGGYRFVDFGTHDQLYRTWRGK